MLFVFALLRAAWLFQTSLSMALPEHRLTVILFRRLFGRVRALAFASVVTSIYLLLSIRRCRSTLQVAVKSASTSTRDRLLG